MSEPPEGAFDVIEKLCEEYKINVAIHNHPKPSRYWDSDTVLKVCGDSEWLMPRIAEKLEFMKGERSRSVQKQGLEERWGIKNVFSCIFSNKLSQNRKILDCSS